MSDQPVIEILRQLRVQPSLRWVLLPQDTFSSGSVFFQKHQFYWDAIGRRDEGNRLVDANQVIMHNNYVIGYTNKIYRLKEMKMYPLDVNGEYSSETARYLVLDSVSCGGGCSVLFRSIEEKGARARCQNSKPDELLAGAPQISLRVEAPPEMV